MSSCFASVSDDMFTRMRVCNCFATAKVVNYFELCKKSDFFVVFKAVYVDYVGQVLIKFQSTASEVKGIVRLLCVYCPSIVRELCVNSA